MVYKFKIWWIFFLIQMYLLTFMYSRKCISGAWWAFVCNQTNYRKIYTCLLLQITSIKNRRYFLLRWVERYEYDQKKLPSLLLNFTSYVFMYIQYILIPLFVFCMEKLMFTPCFRVPPAWGHRYISVHTPNFGCWYRHCQRYNCSIGHLHTTGK